MQSRTCILSAFTLGTAMALGVGALAADLPKEGTIKIHSNFKGSPQVVQVGEKHLIGMNNAWGVTYNDAGSGLLHMGTLSCTTAFEYMSGSFNDAGYCYLGDAGGADKIFVTFSGKGTDNSEQGTGTITGGIGKFAGIQGKLAYQCKAVDASQNIFACTQQIDYQIHQ